MDITELERLATKYFETLDDETKVETYETERTTTQLEVRAFLEWIKAHT